MLKVLYEMSDVVMIDINVINTSVAIVGGVIGIVVSVMTGYSYIKKGTFDLFSSAKIQKYKIPEYKYIVLKHKMISMLFIPSTSILLWTLICNLIWDKVSNFLIIEWYIIFSIAVFVFQDSKKYFILKKLREICKYINQDCANKILLGEDSKNIKFSIIMFNFLIMMPIGIIFSDNLYIRLIFLFEVLLYTILIIVITFQYTLYKNKYYIIPNTTIKLDYKKMSNCYCNIYIKDSYGFKIENDVIIIFYPGDIGTYIIPQKHLISVQVGYKVINTKEKVDI
ncbi:hypothetical protein [Sedimentibacter sp. LTW-03]|uniref:hypothetical protein n=1 Tax=Sedimentibacter sp. LTW-03 TaxID=3453406 RepID=UPI003F832279